MKAHERLAPTLQTANPWKSVALISQKQFTVFRQAAEGAAACSPQKKQSTVVRGVAE
jgi:hypothetical protein